MFAPDTGDVKRSTEKEMNYQKMNLCESAILGGGEGDDSFNLRPSQDMYIGIVDNDDQYLYDDANNLFDDDEGDSLLKNMNEDPHKNLNPTNFTNE